MNRKLLSIITGVFLAAGLLVNPVSAVNEEDWRSVDESDNAEMTTATNDSILQPTFEEIQNLNNNTVKLRFGANEIVFGNNFKEETSLQTQLLLSAGYDLQISGSSEYGFFAGYNVIVSSWVRKDLFAAGQAITLTDDAYIGGDVFTAAETVLVQSDLGGDLSVAAGTLVLDNVMITGNLNADVETIEIRGNVSVEGIFNYNEAAKIVNAESLVAENRQTFVSESNKSQTTVASQIWSQVISFLSLFVIIAVMLAVRPRLYDRITEYKTGAHIATNLGFGFVAVILAPAIALALLFTVIGAPLSVILIVAYMILFYVANGFSGIWLGNIITAKIFKKKSNKYLDAFVGILILNVLALIPYVNAVVFCLSTMFGFGVVVNTLICGSKTTKKKSAKK